MNVGDIREVLSTRKPARVVVLKTNGPLLPNATYEIEIDPEYRDEKDPRIQIYATRRVY